MKANHLLNHRRAGILLHITSLPNSNGKGNLGKEAYNFVNFLSDVGIKVWQTLPLGVPHLDGSPYQCLSAHAGNPALIDIEALLNKDWLQNKGFKCQCECNLSLKKKKHCLLSEAFGYFQQNAEKEELQNFVDFCNAKSGWLDDFALFSALREDFAEKSWNQWPDEFKNRDPLALKKARRRLDTSIKNTKFEQFIFHSQWNELKDYANKNNVLLFGDIPIFVSYDSVDVWANRDVFKLNVNGDMSVVAGVPPDYFSETGQRWGNPHYDWSYLRETGFEWWIERMKSQLELFDILRIDHFRGFEAAWEIAADEETAINGKWVKAPGHFLLDALKKSLGDMPLVAEDLGVITEEVETLRDNFDLPGMKILQFSFGDSPQNPYLPHNYDKNTVVYTGTHDNNTSLGWFNELTEKEQHNVYQYLGFSPVKMPYVLIGTAFSSVSNLAIVPMQDILELDESGRMNTPGTITGNWQWQFTWEQLTLNKATKLKNIIAMFAR